MSKDLCASIRTTPVKEILEFAVRKFLLVKTSPTKTTQWMALMFNVCHLPFHTYFFFIFNHVQLTFRLESKYHTKNIFALRWKYVCSIWTSLGRKSNFAYECMGSISSNMITYHRILCTSCQVLYLLINNDVNRLWMVNNRFSVL